MMPPGFVVDAMLGRLATWLRLLGVDAQYVPHTPDEALLAALRGNDRWLLTRDRALADRAAGRSFFVHYQRYPDQLREVLSAFPALADEERVFTRCTICNSPLERVEKEAARGRVPSGVFAQVADYWTCAACRTVYWRGSHYDQALRLLKDIRRHPITARSRF